MGLRPSPPGANGIETDQVLFHTVTSLSDCPFPVGKKCNIEKAPGPPLGAAGI